MKDVELLSISVVTDDSAGIYSVGELDFGKSGYCDDYLKDSDFRGKFVAWLRWLADAAEKGEGPFRGMDDTQRGGKAMTGNVKLAAGKYPRAYGDDLYKDDPKLKYNWEWCRIASGWTYFQASEARLNGWTMEAVQWGHSPDRVRYESRISYGSHTMTPEQKIDKLSAQIKERAAAILEMRIKNTDAHNQIWHLKRQIRAEILADTLRKA